MNGRTNSTTSNNINIDITKSPFATLPPSDLVARRGNQKIDIGWIEPITKVAVPGDDIVAKREYTILIRNDEHVPVDKNDGVELYRHTDQTESSPGAYSDTGLTNGHEYFYGLISITDNNIPSEVATISMIPSMAVGYSGTLDSLNISGTSGDYRIAAATAGDNQAIFIGTLYHNEYDNYYNYIENINAYNNALIKQDIALDYELPDNTYGGIRGFEGVSLNEYALFGLCGSSYRSSAISIVTFNSDLTRLSNNLEFTEDCQFRHGTAFNNYACWYSSAYYEGGTSGHTQWPRNFEYVSENLTLSIKDFGQYSIDGKDTSGLRVIGNKLCIGPGYSRNVSTSAYKYHTQSEFISADWTIQHTSWDTGSFTQRPSNTGLNNMLESTGTYILYSNGGTTIETLDENMTKGTDLSNPFATNTANHWHLDEFTIIFANGTPGDCVAYDKYLTATYPSDVTQAHTYAIATTLQNHAIFAGRDNNNVDVYSI